MKREETVLCFLRNIMKKVGNVIKICCEGEKDVTTKLVTNCFVLQKFLYPTLLSNDGCGVTLLLSLQTLPPSLHSCL